ncbi:MAG: fibronectin type III domain-containing protein [Elusimicrobiota bacterium]
MISKAVDTAGNIQVSFPTGISSVTFKFDNNGPEPIIMYPSNGYHNSITAISGTVMDAEGNGIAQTEFRIKRNSDNNYFDGTGFNVETSSWNIGTPNGSYAEITGLSSIWTTGVTYVIDMRGLDLSGNYSASNMTRTVTYDVSAPTVTIQSPAANSQLSVLNAIYGTVSDTASGVSSVNLKIRRSSGEYWTGTSWGGETVSSATLSSGASYWSYTSGVSLYNNLSDGVTYYISVSAADNLANASVWGVLMTTVTYDVSSPTSVVTFPGNGATVENLNTISGTSFDMFGVNLVRIAVRDTTTGLYWDGVSSFDQGSIAYFDAAGKNDWTYSAVKSSNIVQAHTYWIHAKTLDNTGNWETGVIGSTFTYNDMTIPGVVTGIAGWQSGVANTITLSWVTPGDDGYINTLPSSSQYKIQYSSGDIATLTWNMDSAQVTISTSGVAPGVMVSTNVSPAYNETYYFKVWAKDEAGNWSVLSEHATVHNSPFNTQTVEVTGIGSGNYASAVIDKNGNSHIAYYSNGTYDLKYASWTGSAWAIQTIDSPGYVGINASLTLDGNGNAHISYWEGGAPANLKYARWTGSTWSVQTVDSDGSVGEYTSIAIDGNDNPHIAYHDTTNEDLKYARWTGTSWSTQTVDSVGTVGDDLAIAVDGNGNPHIAYSDTTNFDLKYAKWNGASWTIQSVDTEGPVGTETSIAIDGNGNPAISYYSAGTAAVKYAKWTGVVWSTQTVDIGGSVGSYTSITMDGTGNPQVAYYDDGQQDLKYARWTGTMWSTHTVDSNGNTGINTSIAVDVNGNPQIVYSDLTKGSLKYTKWPGAGLSAPMGGNARGKVQAPTAFRTTPGDIGVSSVTWRWTDNASNELGYRIYSTTQSPYVMVASTNNIGVDGTSYTIQNLLPSTSYQMYVAAVNNGGVVTSSAAVAWTYAAVPSNLTVNYVSSATASLQWNNNGNAVATTKYRVSYADNSGFSGETFTSWEVVTSTIIAGLNGYTTYYFRVQAKNEDGIVTAYSIEKDTRTVDNTPPAQVSLTSPVNPYYTNNQSVVFDWSDSSDTGGSGVMLYSLVLSTDSGFKVIHYSNDTAVSSATISGIQQNTYYWTVKAFDAYYNESSVPSSYTLYIDTTAPVSALTNVVHNSFVASLTTINGTGSDDVLISTVQVSVRRALDGYYWNRDTSNWVTDETFAGVSGGLGNWSFTSVPAWENGKFYTIVSKALDTAGNAQTVFTTGISSVTFKFDIAGPVVTMGYPYNAYYNYVDEVNGTVSDPEGNTVVQAEFRIRRQSDNYYFDGTGFNVVTSSWNIATDVEGTYKLTGLSSIWTDGVAYVTDMRAKDASGNYSTTYSTKTFTYDISAPTVTIQSPAAYAQVSTITAIYGTVSETISSISSVHLQIKRLADGLYWRDQDGTWGVAVATMTTLSSGSTYWSYAGALFANLNDGNTYYITVNATDQLPNSTGWDIIKSSFVYDISAPTSAVTSPVNGAVIDTLSSINGTAADTMKLSSIKIAVRNNKTMMYWSGGGAFNQSNITFNTATGKNEWSFNAITTNDLILGASYWVLTHAVDGAGNEESAVVGSTFTYNDMTVPGVVTGIVGWQSGVVNTITLSWITPGDDGSNNTLANGSEYKIQYSSGDIATLMWNVNSAQVTISTSGVAPGVAVSTNISPAYNETYYFKVWAKDEAGNYSPLSQTSTAYNSPFAYEIIDGSNTEVGSPTSMTIDMYGNIHLSYYDLSSTGLKYIKKTGTTWGTPVSIDSEGDVGQYNSIALDNMSKPHISYTNNDSGGLKYAEWDGSKWSTTTIHSGSNIGYYTSIILDNLNNVHISYYSNGKLAYAKFNGICWSTQTVDSATDTGYNTSIALDSYGNPCISYRDQSSGVDNSDLRYARWNGTTWDLETVESVGNVGWWNTMVVDSENKPHIVYLDSTMTTFKHATKSSSWNIQSVNDSGWYPSIVLDGNSNIHMVYMGSQYDLKYAKWDGVAWSTQTIDSLDNVGWGASILIDANGILNISYNSYSSSDLRIANLPTPVISVPMGGNTKGKLQVPTAFRANMSDIGISSITWSWTDNASNELGFRIYSCTSTSYSLIADTNTISPVASIGETGSYTTINLTPNTSYQMYVAAVNAGGVATSSATTTYTLANPTTGSYVLSVTSYQISIGWGANYNPSNTRFGVIRSTDNFISTTTVVDFGTNYTNIMYVDDISAITPGTTCWYKINAFNGDGIASKYDVMLSTLTIDNIAPAATLNLSATSTEEAVARLTWTASGDDNNSNMLPVGSRYIIQYSTWTNWQNINWSTTNAQVELSTSNVNPGTLVNTTIAGLLTKSATYYFRIWTADEVSNWSPLSNGATVWIRIGAGFTGSFSQPGGVVFDAGSIDNGYGVVIDTTAIGGPFVYVVINSSRGITGTDIMTIKYDSDGVVVASTSFNGGQSDYAGNIARDQQGNIYIGGSINAGENGDFLVLKYSPVLVFISSTVFVQGSEILDLQVSNNNNLYVTGYTLQSANHNYVTVKYDANLVFKSSSNFHYIANDAAYGMAIDNNENVFVTGNSYNGANWDCLTVKYDANLVFKSSVVYNSGIDDYTMGDADTDDSGNVYVIGTSSNNFFTIKYSNNLTLVSSTTYDSGNVDGGSSIDVDEKGNVFTVGHANYDYFAIKYNSSLSQVFSSATYNSGYSDGVSGCSIGVFPYLYVVGSSNNDSRVVRFSMGDVTSPSTPIMESPLNSATTNQAVVSFNWDDSIDSETGISYYELQVSTDIYFNTINFSSSPVISQANLVLGENVYYWRLRVKDNANNFSQWSSTRAVNVNINVHEWDGGGADNLASNPQNWTYDVLPSSGDNVIIGSLNPTKACTWDLPYSIEIGSFNVIGSYNEVIDVTSHLVVNKNLTLSGQTGSNFVVNASSIVIKGAMKYYTGKFDAKTSTVCFINGSVSQANELLQETTFYSLTVHSVGSNITSFNNATIFINGNLFLMGNISGLGGAGELQTSNSTVYFRGNANRDYMFLDDNAVNSKWVIDGTNAQSIVSSALHNVYDLEINKVNGSTVTINSAQTILNNLTIKTGVFNFWSVWFTVNGNITVTSPGVLNHGNWATVYIGGSKNTVIDMRDDNTIDHLYVNKTAAGYTTTFARDTVFDGSLTNYGGTLDISNRNITIKGSLDLENAAAFPFVTTGSTVTVYGQVSPSSGTFNVLRLKSTASLRDNYTANVFIVEPGATVSLYGSGFNSGLIVNNNSEIYGSFDIRSGTFTALGQVSIQDSGVLDFTDTAGGVVKLQDKLEVKPGGVIKSNSVLDTIDSFGSGNYSFIVNGGTVNVNGLVIKHLGKDGVQLNDSAYVKAFDNVQFVSAAVDGIGVNVVHSGTTQYVFNNLSFDASVTTNVSVANLVWPGYVLVKNAAGDKPGPAYEYDPNNVVFWSTPTVPGALIANEVYTSSITWGWADTSNDEKYYRIKDTNGNVMAELAGNTTWWKQTGLGVNTSTSVSVEAYNPIGVSSLTNGAYSSAKQPTGTYFVATSSDTTELTWEANGNPAGTKYGLLVSNDNFGSNSASLLDSTSGYTSTSYQVKNLAPLTQYWFKVCAYNNDNVITAYDSVVTTTTVDGEIPPSAPSEFTGVAVSTYSINWSWKDNANNETGYRVKSYYDNVILKELPVNTTYYIQENLSANISTNVYVSAYNDAGTTSSGNAFVFTLANKPSNTAVQVTSGSVVVTWSANENPASTKYYVNWGTDETMVTTSTEAYTNNTTQNLITGITPLTSYYIRVLARNNDNKYTGYDTIKSTMTDADKPAAVSALTAQTIDTASVRYTWTGVANTFGYKVKSNETNAVIGTVSAGTVQYDVTGLGVNTSTNVYVESYNSYGASAVSAVTGYTHASAPTSSAMVTCTSNTAVVSWSANSNPAGTVYGIARSMDNFASSTTLKQFSDGYTALSYTDTALSPATVYYYKVVAYNTQGVITAYDSTVSTTTMPGVPSAVTLTGTAVSNNSINWTWADVNSVSTQEDGYKVRSAADNNVLSSLAADTTYYVQTGIGINVSTSVYVEAYNITGSTSCVSKNAYTYANQPTGTYVKNVSSETVDISWGTSSNPAATEYKAELATDSGITANVSNSGWVSVSSYSFTGLSALTPYYVRVQSRNGDSIFCGYDSVVSTTTTPGKPSSADPVSMGALTPTSVRVTWTNAANEQGYRIKSAADNNVLATLGADVITADLTGIGINTSTSVYVESYNASGSSASATVSKYTLSNVPASTTVQVSSGSINVTWTANSNPAGTKYYVNWGTDAGFVTTSTEAYTSNTMLSITSGITPLTTYYLRVLSQNNEGINSGYDTSVSTRTDADKPNAPVILSVAAVDNSIVRITWTSVSNAFGYKVYSTADNSELATVSATQQDIPGLGVNTSTTVYVRAYNTYGYNTSISTTVYTQASIPAGLTVLNVSSGSINVQWTSNSNPSGTMYYVNCSNDPSFVSGVFTSAGQTGLSLDINSGLTALTTYYLRVYARNGDSVDTGYSSTVSTTTNPGAPSAPAFIMATSRTQTSLTWGWAGVTNETGYRVKSSTGGVLMTLPADTLTWTETGLEVNTQVTRYVEAYNVSGSNASSTSSAYTLTYVPTGTTIANVTSSQVLLSWSANGNPGTTEYRIDVSQTPGFDSVNTSTTTSTNIFVNSISADTTYYFRVYSRNGDSIDSGYDTTVSTRTLPTGTPAVPTSFNGTATAPDSINWNWADNATNETGYRVKDTIGNVVTSLPANTTSWPETGLSVNTMYIRYVYAYNTLGETVAIGTGTAMYTFANTPSSLNAYEVNVASVGINWNTNSNPINTGYKVELSTNIAFSTNVNSLSTQLSSITVTGLIENTTYYVRVKAENGQSVSTQYSAPVTFITIKAQDTTAPAAAGITALPGSTEGKIVLYWTAPGDDGYTNNLDTGTFVIQVSTDYSTTWNALKVGNTSITAKNVAVNSSQSYVFTGLIPDTTYHFVLWTIDENNNYGAASNIASTYAQHDVTPPTEVGVISALTGTTDGMISLMWTSPTEDGTVGGRVISYVIRYNTLSKATVGNNGNIWWTLTNSTQVVISAAPMQPGITEAVTITGLENNTVYYFGIASVDDKGNVSGLDTGLMSGIQTSAVSQQDITPTSNVILTSVLAGDSKVTLTWTNPGDKDFVYTSVYASTVGYITTQGVASALIHTSSSTQGEFVHQPLFSGVTQYYTLYSYDNVNNYSSGVSTAAVPLFDTISPAAVTTLSAVPNALDGNVILTWTSVGDDGNQGELKAGAKYYIEYSTISIPGEFVYTTADIVVSTMNVPAGILLEYKVTGLIPSVTYFFAIFTADELGNTGLISNIVNCAAQDVVPAAPVNLRISSLQGKKFYLSWKPNTEPDIKEYRVYRGDSTGRDSAILTSVDGTQNAYIDTQLEYGASYYYNVYAYDYTDHISSMSSGVVGYIKDVIAGGCLSDKFSDIDRSNTLWQPQEGYWSVDAVNGNYAHLVTSVTGLSFIANKSYTNISYQAKVRIEEGTTAGLAFRMADPENGYKYVISMDSVTAKLVLLTMKNVELASTYYYTINPSSWVWLKVSCDGAVKTAYVSTDGINYAYVFSASSNTAYAQGFVGLFTENTRAVFDDVRVILNPKDVAVTPDDHAVYINWSVDKGNGVAGYRVYRSSVDAESVTFVQWTDLPTLLDTGLVNGVTYYYKVATVDGEGNESVLVNAGSTYPRVSPDTISGKVTQADGTPLTGIIVEAKIDNIVKRTVGTYTDGTYILNGLTPGTTYMIIVTYWAGETASVVYRELISGNENIDFTLGIQYQLGTITGQLAGYKVNDTVWVQAQARAASKFGKNSINYAIPAVRTALFVPNNGVGYVELYRSGKLVVTVPVDDRDGSFVIPNLLPGKYNLRAYNGVSYNETQQVKVVEGGSNVLTLEFAIDVKSDTVHIYPNPCNNGMASISFISGNTNRKDKLEIYDIAGEKVFAIDDGFISTSGNKYVYQWACVNTGGVKVSAGVYIAVVTVSSSTDASDKVVVRKKVVVVK